MTFEAIPHLLADILQEQKNTNDAIIRLAEAIAGVRAKIEAPTVAAKAAATQAIAKAATPAPEIPPAVAPAANVPAAAPASTPESPAPLDYKKDVAPTFAKLLSAKGAPAIVELLSKFSVKKGVDLQTAQLPEALAAAQAALVL